MPRPVVAEPDATGTVDGAALLSHGPDVALQMKVEAPIPPLATDLASYAEAWHRLAVS